MFTALLDGVAVRRPTEALAFTACTDEGKRVYDLHGRELRPRSGTPTQVSEGKALATAATG